MPGDARTDEHGAPLPTAKTPEDTAQIIRDSIANTLELYEIRQRHRHEIEELQTRHDKELQALLGSIAARALGINTPGTERD